MERSGLQARAQTGNIDLRMMLRFLTEEDYAKSGGAREGWKQSADSDV